MSSSYKVIQSYYLYLVCSEYLTQNCGYNDNVTISIEYVSSKKMFIIVPMLLKCIYVYVYSDIIWMKKLPENRIHVDLQWTISIQKIWQ